MSYSEVDSTIKAWTQRHGFTLFDRYDGFPDSPLRLVYLSSPEGECYRIWIEEPNSGVVVVCAADVETRNAEQFRRNWSAPIIDLNSALEAAVAQVGQWMRRK